MWKMITHQLLDGWFENVVGTGAIANVYDSPGFIFSLGVIVQHMLYRVMREGMDRNHRHQRSRRDAVESGRQSAGEGSTEANSNSRPASVSPVSDNVCSRLAAMDAYSRQRTGLYMLSALHAIVVSTFALWSIVTHGYLLPDDRTDGILASSRRGSPTAAAGHGLEYAKETPGPGIGNYHTNMMVLSYSLSYFLHDFLVTLPEWQAHPADLVHHLLGLCLVFSCMVNVSAARLCAHILVTESSTPFLNLMWLLKKLNYEKGRTMRVSMVLFVATFFVSRLVYLPYTTWMAYWHLWNGLVLPAPQTEVAMVSLCVLNAYWFNRIVKMLLKVVRSPTGEIPSASHSSGGGKSAHGAVDDDADASADQSDNETGGGGTSPGARTNDGSGCATGGNGDTGPRHRTYTTVFGPDSTATSSAVLGSSGGAGDLLLRRRGAGAAAAHHDVADPHDSKRMRRVDSWRRPADPATTGADVGMRDANIDDRQVGASAVVECTAVGGRGTSDIAPGDASLQQNKTAPEHGAGVESQPVDTTTDAKHSSTAAGHTARAAVQPALLGADGDGGIGAQVAEALAAYSEKDGHPAVGQVSSTTASLVSCPPEPAQASQRSERRNSDQTHPPDASTACSRSEADFDAAARAAPADVAGGDAVDAYLDAAASAAGGSGSTHGTAFEFKPIDVDADQQLLNYKPQGPNHNGPGPLAVDQEQVARQVLQTPETGVASRLGASRTGASASSAAATTGAGAVAVQPGSASL